MTERELNQALCQIIDAIKTLECDYNPNLAAFILRENPLILKTDLNDLIWTMSKDNTHHNDFSLIWERIYGVLPDINKAIRDKPTPPDANIRFEILAKAFFYDTKMMAPGKSIAAAMNPPYTEEDRSKAWDKWLKENDVPKPPADDAEKTLNNLTKLLNEDDGDEEYIERCMAIVNDWRKKHSADDALVEAVRRIIRSIGTDDYTLDQVYVYLEDALAAHKQAVR